MPIVPAMATGRNPEHAIHTTDNSADACADRAANSATDRPRRTVAFANALICAAFHASNDALRICNNRQRKDSQSGGHERKTPMSRSEHKQSFRLHPEKLRGLAATYAILTTSSTSDSCIKFGENKPRKQHIHETV